jgi:hypothetical protein
MTADRQPSVFASLLAAYEAERRGTDDEDGSSDEHDRYLLAMLDPDHCQLLHPFSVRKEGGLVLHCDGTWEENVAWIDDAERSVSQDCGYPVEAVEHHEDNLWYWTFRPKQPTSAVP